MLEHDEAPLYPLGRGVSPCETPMAAIESWFRRLSDQFVELILREVQRQRRA